MEFWTTPEDFSSWNHATLSRFPEWGLRLAISSFFDQRLIDAGNMFLEIYEDAQNEMQNSLSCLSPKHEPELWRQWQRYLIQDAALCFYLAYLANSNDVTREKKVFPFWPKTQSALLYKKQEYKKGEGIGTILQCMTPLDIFLEGSTSSRELAERLCKFCRSLSGDPGNYLPVTECIFALKEKRPTELNDALKIAKRNKDKSACKWITNLL
ncbi:hypothetical protein V496_00946 [Pseudogymnoascus sp. VKM F-4515 (FW-2607)]|nr:hypothetical protein V496_00946 [Pseudogymnoascus sp. VKM F-4515 (FW-2607)]